MLYLNKKYNFWLFILMQRESHSKIPLELKLLEFLLLNKKIEKIKKKTQEID